ncbi:MAG: flagellin, partial [Paracoccaceae bacterium]
ILSSLDRAADGSVVDSSIDVVKQDLGTNQESIDASGTFTAAAVPNTVINTATASADIDLSALAVAGTAVTINFVGTDADANTFTPADYTNATTGGTTVAEAIAGDVTYVVRDGDTAADIGSALADAFATYAAENGLDTSIINLEANSTGLTASKTATFTDAGDNIQVRVASVVSDENVIGGGLAALADIDVSTAEGSEAALAAIEGLIQTSIDSAAALGSAGSRIETQSNFVSALTDNLKSGIGALVDADMEATSAKLQALQTQQQLGVQSLSIANQAPQTILSLFR